MAMQLTVCGILLVLATISANEFKFPPPCDSDIYCQGALLHTVQMARIHSDSKHFVDMSMRLDPGEVKANFELMMSRTNQDPSRDDVRKFLEHNFQEPGSEFVTWDPSDWVENPVFLSRIKDAKLRDWVRDLHVTWKELGREVGNEVYLHPDRYSLIFVPNPTIVPGGRFREYYYWDSYWVIKGLLLSEMHSTARGMLENFLVMVNRFGFVPNGGRVYYERRSQPPFLIPMVKLYLDATGDVDFIRANLKILQQEFDFWHTKRSIRFMRNAKTYAMYHYDVSVGQPRPESYREDYELAYQAHGGAANEGLREMLYVQLKSTAESGWDFSTRWMVRPAGKPASLEYLNTSYIVPVDLNSLLYLNARLLSEFNDLIGDTTQSAEYKSLADQQRRNIEEVLWDPEFGSWFDWNTITNSPNRKFYASNMYPVWVNASTTYENARFVQYMVENGATSETSGVPTSFEGSGQQWDFPNAWPPLQHVVVESLNNMGNDYATQLAFQLVQKWIDTNYLSYMESQPHAMFEKYDVTRMGLPGGGGEYDVQVGFGWTNGVAMALANQYGDRLRAPDSGAGQAATPGPLLLLLPLLATVGVPLAAYGRL